ncbi:E3 ubiquitin-protein ligase CCNB1IP1 [Erysiphe neolycopersici]|uniref:E3 ubiquitin-protein ligase CCNB1IP1 n=1 Tax=Erysiphe neolycopersici TaxID=212602 RepID=A0A420HZQ7_9PEZI|nr:E3 ubiquitin-protein ligase CCNB1IP1 [Erysiphe neolycopersici]
MEHVLRCNTLKCRQELGDRALITTCSHCFCLNCANRFQLLSKQDEQHPACPACHMHLTNPDDAVLANLNPTEDYKTSVLSGLSPNIIVECAGRALSFWAYQTTQEIVYQEYCAKNLTNKYAALNSQMDKIIHDANSELSNLRSKISSIQSEQESLRQKNRDLAQQLRERTRKHHETQELYDKLKRRTLLGHVQDAASEAVEQTIQNSLTANRYVDASNNQNINIPPPPLFSSNQPRSMLNMETSFGRNMSNRPLANASFPSYLRPGHVQTNQMQTPSTHRTKFPHGKLQPQVGAVSGLEKSFLQKQYRISPREPMGNLGSNNTGFTGYGMSAGLKVSNPITLEQNSLHRLSQATQLQPSDHTANNSTKFGIHDDQNIFADPNTNC